MSENLNPGNQNKPVNLGKKPPRPAGQKPGGIKRPMQTGAPVTDKSGAPGMKQGQGAAPRQGGMPPKRQQGAPVKGGQAKRPGTAEPIIRSEGGAQRAPRNGQPPRRAPQQRPPQRQPMPRRGAEPRPDVDRESFSSVIKGIIALAATCFAVCVIVIMFAQSLFVSDAELQKTAKTGRLTETAFEVIEPKQQLRDEVVTTKATKKKKTTTAEEDAPIDTADVPEGLDTSIAGTYMVNSPVYLHPTTDANSENLATLPYGETLTVLGQNGGWYYVEYNGQKGYAWGTFFTKS